MSAQVSDRFRGIVTEEIEETKGAAKEAMRPWIQGRHWATLIALIVALVTLDSFNPFNIPLLIDEIIIGYPVLVSARELFRRIRIFLAPPAPPADDPTD